MKYLTFAAASALALFSTTASAEEAFDRTKACAQLQADLSEAMEDSRTQGGNDALIAIMRAQIANAGWENMGCHQLNGWGSGTHAKWMEAYNAGRRQN